MTDQTSAHPLTLKRVLFETPDAGAVGVQRNLPFPGADSAPLLMDIYTPAPLNPAEGPLLPAVILVEGFRDPGFKKMLGCSFKDMASIQDWARLIAARGLAAITYSNQSPAEDLVALIEHLRGNSAALGLDADRMGLWSCSGHGPLALSLLLDRQRPWLRGAAFLNPYLLDLDGHTGVADASAQFRFVNPNPGRTLDGASAETALFIARAGRDAMPGLNDALDRFVARALGRNLSLSVVNHREGPHSFDLDHDSPRTREVIRQTLDFLVTHLSD